MQVDKWRAAVSRIAWLHAAAGLLVLAGLSACASALIAGEQRAAAEFELPDTGPPAYASGTGPRVGIDEAHANFHTAAGRYAPFASLLRRDGYRVGPFALSFTAESLSEVDLLVISNAQAPGDADWALPYPAAFESAEVDAVEGWVRGGGSLLLIADHMPLPGAAAELGEAFGVLFHDGFAFTRGGEGRMTFRLDDGSLALHPVTRPDNGPAIEWVTTFTGQAFRVLDHVDADPLMRLRDGSYLLLPSVAWEFDDSTPSIPASGLLQGALIRHGAGRVAVFGEAAAFTAQVSDSDEGVFRSGMIHPEAGHNARFVLNVVAWLTANQASGS